MSLPTVRLAPKGDGPARGRHPWVFSGAIARVEGEAAPGDEVRVLDSTGDFVGRGLFNPHSQIRVRVYRWQDEPLDDAFFAERIRAAAELRAGPLGLGDPDGACRLVFSEGDGLSGLTVDRYGRQLVVQLTALALHRRIDALLDALDRAVAPTAIMLRTEKGMADEEGLVVRDGPLRGSPSEEPIEIVENGLRFGVDLRTGQKTGFYLDQRVNRARVAAYAAGREVADVCSYSGGFSVATLRAGAARSVAVDSSASALEVAAANAMRNLVEDRVDRVRANAFEWLEEQGASGRRFGMVVLDPPRFARSRRGVNAALQAYRRLNALALLCLEPGGVLATFSCSGRVSEQDFQGAVSRAAADSGRAVRIVERLAQAPDHPVSATSPQGAYLKGFVCLVE